MGQWKRVYLSELLLESKVESPEPNASKRLRVRLNVNGVEKRPDANDKQEATKYYIRRAGQFLYGRQNLHKGAFGVVPKELDGFESSADIPAFDVSNQCISEWICLFLKQGNYYLELEELASGVGSKRISPKKFLTLKIPLPFIEQQEIILDYIKRKTSIHDKLKAELTYQQTLLEKLRQTILQEAIEGKLTADWRKQNPTVEPARQLLTRIQTEKAQSVKIQKSLPPIKADEIPFELPEGWVWCRLGEISDVKVGATPARGNPAYWGGKINWVSSGEVANNIIIETKETITPLGVAESSAEINPKGSVLVAMIGQGKTRGQTAILDIDAATNQNVAAIRLFGILPKMIWYFFMSRYEITRSGASGGNQPALNGSKIRNTVLALPPLAEQKAIVAKVESLLVWCDELVRQNNLAHSHVEQVIQMILKEVFQ